MSAIATPTTALRAEGLNKDFGGVHAVADVGFSVGAGEILGIIGPNGSGKTTLLNLVSGVMSADAGTVWLGGRDVSRRRSFERARLGLARTFQNLRLFRNLSVFDNLLIGGHVGPWFRGGIADTVHSRQHEYALRERASTVLRDLDLEGDAERMAGALAYGTQRRVEIARSLMSEPSVLLLDEPVAGMNDVEAGAIRDLLGRVRASGVAQVVIEHNVAFITRLADRVLVMDAGRVLVTGLPADIVRDQRVITAYLG